MNNTITVIRRGGFTTKEGSEWGCGSPTTRHFKYEAVIKGPSEKLHLVSGFLIEHSEIHTLLKATFARQSFSGELMAEIGLDKIKDHFKVNKGYLPIAAKLRIWPDEDHEDIKAEDAEAVFEATFINPNITKEPLALNETTTQSVDEQVFYPSKMIAL